MEDTQNNLYAGNLFWILEAFKREFKEIKFLKEDLKAKDDDPFPERIEPIKEEMNGLIIYDSVIFNEGKGDSFYFMKDKKLFEFYSIEKTQVLHKMVQKYSERNPPTEEDQYTLTEQKYSKLKNISSFTPVINDPTEKWMIEQRKKKEEKNKKGKGKELKEKEKIKRPQKIFDPEEQFRIKVKANIRITLKNKEVKWLYDKEIKNLLFSFPYLSQTQIVRFFPLAVTKEELELKYFEFSELGEQYSEEIEAKSKPEEKLSKNITLEEKEILNQTIEDIKQIFYYKYLLSLKYIKLSFFQFKGNYYLDDVQKVIFEKLENRHIKLDSEAYYFQYLKQHKGYCELDKVRKAKVMKEIPKLYDAMVNKFNQQFNAIVDPEYMTYPKRDQASNNAFKELNPECEYPLHELLEEHVDLKTFVNNATHNLWKMGEPEEYSDI